MNPIRPIRSRQSLCRTWSWGWLAAGMLLVLPVARAAPVEAFGCRDGGAGFSRAESPCRHPVSIVEADVFVQQTRTIMRLKCFADELELLQGVEALADGRYDPDELREATADHARFLAERIRILDAAGNPLVPEITEIVHLVVPEAGIRQGELMNHSLGFQLEYGYEQPPEFITIVQNMVGEGYLLPSELKILLRQAGSDTPYLHMMKPEMPETFRFDWSKPVLDSKASDADWQKWFDEQREATLGITSYSSVYSFLYIERFETRHEILIPLATLATLIDFQRADPHFLDVGEQEAAAAQIRRFFSTGNEVCIDGVSVAPVFDRIDFYGLDLRDFAIQAAKQKISLASGRIGLILSYPCRTPPREVTVTWDLFNDAIKTVDSVVFSGNRTEKTQFSSFIESNTYRWSADSAPGALPAIVDVSGSDLPRLPPPELPLLSIGLGLAGLISLVLSVASCRGAGNGDGGGGRFARTLVTGSLLAGAWIALPCARLALPWPERLAPVSEPLAGEIFSQLHRNLFRAFDYSGESDIYDALAHSVDGPLLKDLYLRIQESLRVREQGGAVARIDEVQLLEGETVPSDGPDPDPPRFDYRCRWNLIGSIEHWGHIHQRTNQYDARFRVELRDGSWKITALETLDEQQGQVKTSLRKF